MTGSAYRWPPGSLNGDYIRSGLGFGLSFFFAILVPIGSLVFPVLVTLTLVFAAFLAQTTLRARTAFALLPEGLGVSGFFGSRMFRWDELDHFALRYYTLRRDKEAGWMDLKLGAAGRTVTLDDRVDGFHAILARAWQAARDRDLGVSASTFANLTAAGLTERARK
jgi:hypothetical protein